MVSPGDMLAQRRQSDGDGAAHESKKAPAPLRCRWYRLASCSHRGDGVTAMEPLTNLRRLLHLCAVHGLAWRHARIEGQSTSTALLAPTIRGSKFAGRGIGCYAE